MQTETEELWCPAGGLLPLCPPARPSRAEVPPWLPPSRHLVEQQRAGGCPGGYRVGTKRILWE